MSVFTTVEPAQLEEFLSRHDLGKAGAFSAIAAGVTNTNYYLDTEAGQFVLTLYEHHSDDELDYILGLQQHLANHGVACAAPVADRRGELYSMLNQRPAAIIKRIAGEVVTQPAEAHCRMIGTELAKLHLAGQDYRAYRMNPRGLDWWLATCDMLATVISAADRRLIDTTMADYRHFAHQDLPQGAIHADLFHDNALFHEGELGGIIDFDYCCNDGFAFDIAVTLNDWAIDRQGNLIGTRVEAILAGYEEIRCLLKLERLALPLLLRAVALRFWLSRLYDQTYPLSGELTSSKSPDEYRMLLRLRTDKPTLF